MNIVIGVSDNSQGELAQTVIRDLAFPELKLQFVHVQEIWPDPGVLYIEGAAYPTQGYFDQMQAEAQGILDQMKITARNHGINDCHSSLLYGNASNELLQKADESKADMLVLGSFDRGAMERLLIGSIGRKSLIHARQSVLIVKDSYRAKAGMSVVIATDHSPYSLRCVDQFLSWRPRGIKHITLVTVVPDGVQRTLESTYERFKADAERLVREGLARANAQLANKLRTLETPCDSRVEVGSVDATLSRVMEETGSDLLILGSQGHGFLERMLIGSTSLEQATKHRYSVLVIRA